MPFPSKINALMPVAAEGDFASANPIVSVPNPVEASFITGKDGANVGRFGWADKDGKVSNSGIGKPTGFIHRRQTAYIYDLMGEYGTLVPHGQPIDLVARADLWVKTYTHATIGQKVFANNTDGTISTGDAGATVAGCTETIWEVASNGEVGDAIKITPWTN